MSSGRLGPASRAPSWRRRKKLASPPGPDSRSTALPMTACSSAAQAASRALSRRASSSTHSRIRSCRASTLTSPVTIGAIAASQAMAAAASPSSQAPSDAPVSDARARCAAHRSRTRAVHWSCSAEPASSSSRSASEICAQAFTGCPARSGSSPAAISRRMASASASWYRWSRVRSSSSPAGAPSASSTRPTSSAHSGVRSPCTTPAPPNVVASFSPRSAKSRPGSSSGRSDRARSYISANSAASSSSPSPAAAAARSTSSASSRCCSGSLAVHRQISRPTDSETCSAASAATTFGWVPALLAQAACPTAAPRVIPVRCISQDTAL